ncbi:MAG TPA: hypothetical protein VIX80_03975 [Candidatus Kapabacteria bacterium]
MIIEDGVLDFLDGNLAPAEEEELLHRLAVSPERRALLKQHLQVRELTSALARKNRYNVPKAVTASLFETLSANGYAGPIFHSSNENAEMLRASLEKNLDRTATKVAGKRSKSAMFFSSMFSFVSGAILMYFFLPSLTAKTVETTFADNTNTASPVVNTNSASSISQISNTSEKTINSTSISSASARSASVRIEGLSPRSNNRNTSTSNNPSVNTNSSSLTIADNSITVSNNSSIEITPNTLDFASRNTNVELGSSAMNIISTNEVIPVTPDVTLNNIPASLVSNGRIEMHKQSQPVYNLDHELATAATKAWWDDGGMRSGSISDIRTKGYFGRDPEIENESSVLDRTTASIRTGGGFAPGTSGVSASLIEFKLSADLNDWVVAKLSYGQFMPYETEAQNAGKNQDGVRQIELVPVLQSKSVVSAELGVRFDIIGAPIELMGGMMTDMKNGIIPRGSVFSHFKLFENFDLGLGVEALLYTNDISSSLADKQNLFSYEHPVLISAPKSEELTGFIGPAIELQWHF